MTQGMAVEQEPCGAHKLSEATEESTMPPDLIGGIKEDLASAR